METLTLQADKRTIVGKQVKTLRAKGVLPGVVYGYGNEPQNIQVDMKTFEKLFAKTGESSLVDLVVNGGNAVKVLVQDVTRDPLRDTLDHVDFRAINMKEKLEVEVEFNFVGEAPASKESGAIIVRSMNVIHVRCLPEHLVHNIDISLASLKKFGDTVKVKDLVPPTGIEFKANPDDVIVVANEPISEDELKALDTAPVVADVSAVKVETEEKKAARAAEAEKKEE